MALQSSHAQVPDLQAQASSSTLADIASISSRHRLRRCPYLSRFGRGRSRHAAGCSIGIDIRHDLSPSPPLNSFRISHIVADA
ncbi:hypothetical protein AURDEDRAFT_177160 [Auricularia subglabra TFB-10046 SS5]|uniref:Uncharacterized protein n=1 Tax=Auricularia subglabra (strain TFB-10046 / SS5) TaxID=717982 RepID=J0LBC9_AURST|nr:hypothetical protein AURDEDRAFT_177160 [Auricularia subglabra TFB-10046 SS5]